MYTVCGREGRIPNSHVRPTYISEAVSRRDQNTGISGQKLGLSWGHGKPNTVNYKHKRSSLAFSRQLWYIIRIACYLLLVQGIMMTGKASERSMKREKKCSGKSKLWDSKACTGAPWGHVFWPAGAKHSEFVLATTKKLGPCKMNKQAKCHWERWCDFFPGCNIHPDRHDSAMFQGSDTWSYAMCVIAVELHIFESFEFGKSGAPCSNLVKWLRRINKRNGIPWKLSKITSRKQNQKLHDQTFSLGTMA